MIRFVIFMRCFLRGHEYSKTPIMVHEAKIGLFNVQAAFADDGKPEATVEKFRIGHELHHCMLCGKVRFSP